MIRVKVCCISSIEEANYAIRSGASALGLVSKMPSGPGVIPESLIKEIAGTVPPPVGTFLLTSSADAAEIIRQLEYTCVNTVQIVDSVNTSVYREIRLALPYVKIVQVIHVTGAESITESEKAAPFCDALLLDSGNPNAKIKKLGGTGRVHNWDISREIVKNSTIPVFLAGGLNPGNVARAIETVRPYGIDLCSGVRTENKLDTAKLKALFASINN